MKFFLATVAALALMAGSASAQTLVLGSGVSGNTQAAANSGSGSFAGGIGNSLAVHQSNNNTQSGATTAVTANAGLFQSSIGGVSAASTNSTSTSAGFSLGLGAHAGGAIGGGSASGGSGGFGGFGFTFP